MTPADEPQEMGAVVRVHAGGKYPEVWIASNMNIGNWYPSQETWLTTNAPTFVQECGGHPTYWDLTRRGRIELLTAGNRATYEEGWQAGCRAVQDAADNLSHQCPGMPEELRCDAS